MRRVATALALGLSLLQATAASAQMLGVMHEAPFPAEPAAWVNSPPLTAKMLKGKAAALFFFLDIAPNVEAGWPGYIEIAKRFEERPVVFIAIAPGVARDKVDAYARKNKLSWPMIVDADRKLERALEVRPIGIDNVLAVKMLQPDGRVIDGDWTKVPDSTEQALKDAKWKIDPMGLSPALKPAWWALETNDSATAGQLLRKLRPNAPAEWQESLTRLDEAVRPEIEALAAEAKAALDAGNKWKAFKAYHQAIELYTGFQLPAGIEAQRKELANDPAVKAGIAASAQLANAKRQMAGGSPLARKRVMQVLEKIVKDSPDSDAGIEAKALLQQFKGG